MKLSSLFEATEDLTPEQLNWLNDHVLESFGGNSNKTLLDTIKIGANGEINIASTITIYNLRTNDPWPVKFGEVHRFSIENCLNFHDFSNFPKRAREFDIFASSSITSIKGLSKRLTMNQTMRLSTNVKSGFLELKKIQGLLAFEWLSGEDDMHGKQMEKLQNIIMDNLLDESADILDFQSALMDNGFGSYQ